MRDGAADIGLESGSDNDVACQTGESRQNQSRTPFDALADIAFLGADLVLGYFGPFALLMKSPAYSRVRDRYHHAAIDCRGGQEFLPSQDRTPCKGQDSTARVVDEANASVL